MVRIEHLGARAACVATLFVLVSLGGCVSPSEGPREVNITSMSPEVMDALADRVADRVASQAGAAQPLGARAGGNARVQPTARSSRPALAVKPVPPFEPAASTPLDPDTLQRLRDSLQAAQGWLARHQAENGSFDPAEFEKQCKLNRCGGRGSSFYAVGVTGLVTLSLLEAGQTPESGTYKDTVARAIRYLMTAQDREGCVGPRVSQHYMYNHGAATLALVEAYKRTHDERLRTAAQSAVGFCESARNPYLGWRYGVRDGDNDTSVTGLMMHVLSRARDAGLSVDNASFQGGLAWFDKMTEPEFGRVGYQQRGGPPARTMEAMEHFPADRSEALTAVALLGRLHAKGISAAGDEFVSKQADLICAKPPRWLPDAGTIDLYYWHWGTEALATLGGPRWNAWSHRLAEALLSGQESGKSGDEFGSWPAIDAWSNEGGRVYTTAMAALSVQRMLAGGSGG